MRRCLPVILILLAIQFTFGQVSTPKVELGLGYSYSYARVPNSTTRVNMNGLLLGASVNANRWLGIEAEFGTHYHCLSDCWFNNRRVDNQDETNDSLSFLVGPKVNFASERKVSPWIHALIGITRTSYSNHLTDTRTAIAGFGWAAGGGLDLPYRAVTFRVIQVDFVRYAAPPENFNNVRFGAGILFRIGHQEK